MTFNGNIKQAAQKLKEFHERALTGTIQIKPYLEMINARDQVIDRFQSLFSGENLSGLTEEEFRSFLRFTHNQHWKSLHRLGGKVCEDMPRLREALSILYDESRPIIERLNELVSIGRSNFVPGLGKAILTPLLLVQFPDRYGVWNRVAQDGMTRHDIWPDIDRKQPFGKKYTIVNEILLQVAEYAGVDLWTLDGLWWAERQEEEFVLPAQNVDCEEGEETTSDARFGLERHLHDFLRDNWQYTDLGKEWMLYEEDGDSDAGYEYRTSVGNIDLLAKHISEPRWMVIELKRNRSSDRTVGQLMRYMGWVKEELAEDNEVVHGLVIAHQADERLRYALKQVPNVDVNLYQVNFKLMPHQ